MTPERRNNSLLDNGGRQVLAEMYKHATTEELLGLSSSQQCAAEHRLKIAVLEE
jgi:hypothetical protein